VGRGCGVIVQLQKAGVSFAVEPTWLPMFSSAVRPTGDETTVLAFAREPLAQELLTDSATTKWGSRTVLCCCQSDVRRPALTPPSGSVKEKDS